LHYVCGRTAVVAVGLVRLDGFLDASVNVGVLILRWEQAHGGDKRRGEVLDGKERRVGAGEGAGGAVRGLDEALDLREYRENTRFDKEEVRKSK